jgi:energy-coupling factor transport system ATP-binding protein
MKEPIIQFDAVHYRYNDDAKTPFAVDGVSLTIGRGEFVAVLGHNACGKSTLAKLCNAILLPDSGVVTVNGVDTARADKLYDIRQAVGLVFQNPDNQIVATVVEEDVAFGPENLGVPPAEIRERVNHALKAVGMYELREKEPHKLSGGQKQRVAIAGTIAMCPDCIILDEPTAMLDPGGRSEIMETVRRLHKEQGKTVLFITHFMEEAAQAERVLVMDSGKVVLDGAPKDVFSNVEYIKSIGLDVPQMAELSHLLRQEGIDLPKDLLTIEAFAAAVETQFHLRKGA